MRAIEAIRNANKPVPPEHSLPLRAGCLGAVIVAIAACASMREISPQTAVAGIGLVSAGMTFSYATRRQPPGWVKLVVAAGAIAASAWFVHAIGAPVADVANVEEPLTLLLVSILVVHSFHVPARRDLMFSLAAAAGLMAVGGAQAIDLTFGFYVLAWATFSFWSLIEMWRSTSGGGRLPVVRLLSVLVAVATTAAAIFLVLPAPTVAAKLSLFAKAGIGGSVGLPGALAGDAGSPSQLSRPGSPSGPTRIGGYLGFAGSLDTALRGSLSNAVVMLVRAQRPTYWVGETFDTWSGQSWTARKTPSHPLRQQSPFVLPLPEGYSPLGASDLQTFYVLGATANLVFHAESADQVWFPAPRLFYSADGTVVSPIGLGQGAVYSVESQVTSATPQELRDATGGADLSVASRASYLQLPHAYPRVQKLARSVTLDDSTTYDRVQSLIAWIGSHTRYSTDIPPLPAGDDTVDEFLFGNRVGFCEQISTSLAVMLRSIGIPAREVVGYVPGPYNPITDLYEVRADDAHAWVQVWFPGFGWQSFDPTAQVPLENPSPGTTALADIGHALGHVPPVPAATGLFGVSLLAFLVQWGRKRPRTWTQRIAHSAERTGRRIGRSRHSHETLFELARDLDLKAGHEPAAWGPLAVAVEASAYGGFDPPPDVRRHLIAQARRLERQRRTK